MLFSLNLFLAFDSLLNNKGVAGLASACKSPIALSSSFANNMGVAGGDAADAADAADGAAPTGDNVSSLLSFAAGEANALAPLASSNGFIAAPVPPATPSSSVTSAMAIAMAGEGHMITDLLLLARAARGGESSNLPDSSCSSSSVCKSLRISHGFAAAADGEDALTVAIVVVVVVVVVAEIAFSGQDDC